MDKPEIADVLAAVNEIRAERGLPPLSAMPKQDYSRDPIVRRRSCCCPMTVALDVWATAGLRYWEQDYEFERTYWERERASKGAAEGCPLPPVCGAFIAAFDAGYYPELIANEMIANG